jgi:cytochrome c biogenesis protein CcmG, thiol:disulfide interchange protein DsbE
MHALLAGVIAFVLAGAAPAAPRPAPRMSLTLEDGRSLRLADLGGKVVLVDFWASWCAPCKVSFPQLDALQRAHAREGLVVVAVNVDEERRDAEAFLAQRPHELTVALDPKGAAAEAFRVDAMPSSFLIGRDGTLRYSHSGYSEKVRAAYAREIEILLREGK